MLYINESTDAYYNLALEEVLMNHGFRGIMLWQNDNAVIVGRNQNTAQEVREDAVRRHNAAVVRRLSGGGAVYHDMGNLNYSFFMEKSDTSDPCRVIADMLRELSLPRVQVARNDIIIDGKKVSGSACFYGKSTLLSHGTLLFNSNLDILAEMLSPDAQKYISKGIPSIRSRVANISDFNGLTIEAFIEKVIDFTGDKPSPIPESICLSAKALADQKYRHWEWNYGDSPPYTYENQVRMPCGLIQVRLSISNGIIQSCRITGDFFSVSDISGLERLLSGAQHNAAAISQRLHGVDVASYIIGASESDIIRALIS